MNWKLCIADPQKRALILCRGSMDEGNGWGEGYGYGDDYGYGDGCGYGYDGDISGDGWGAGYGWNRGDGNGCGYGDFNSGGSPEEWE